MTKSEMLGRNGFIRYQRELARDNLQVVIDNGFDAPTWETVPLRVMLVITEVDEGIDAILIGDGDPLPEELADIWIRLTGILVAIWGEDQWAVRYGFVEKKHVYESIEVLMWPIVSQCCKAVEAWRKEHKSDTRIYLEMALKELAILALSLDVKLTTEIEKKLHKNRHREKFHGKAKPGA